MNPALIPVLSKIGETIVDRLAGSKKATAASILGAGAITATATIDPGALLYPEDALLANSILYVIGALLMAWRGRKQKYNPFAQKS